MDSVDDNLPLTEIQANNTDMVKILPVSTKLRGKNGFMWSGKKGSIRCTPKGNLAFHLTGKQKRGFGEADKEIPTSRREYLNKLSLELVKPHMISRLEAPTLKRQLRETICSVLKISAPEEGATRPQATVGRCALCLRKKTVSQE
ncbi:hypothetical protein WA026_014777 [Henosepilachna vigintioctopunctata]|uniref:Uncharacterized protein n=1 Tax=Henosepilachna vigintioctopunctata TaxID=420089 RepID=A0AAW1V1N4_9CUCU